MTEEEGQLIFEVKEEYWVELGKLVTRQLAKVPVHLEANLLMQMQEASSLYSRYEGN